jgi:hypothetical protein
MGSLSSGQRGREFRQLSDIKGVCGHSGSADKIGEGLHGNYSSRVDLRGRSAAGLPSAKAQEVQKHKKASTSLTR